MTICRSLGNRRRHSTASAYSSASWKTQEFLQWDALTVFNRSASPNKKSDDQSGDQDGKMVEGFVQGEAGIIRGENCVAGNDLGRWNLWLNTHDAENEARCLQGSRLSLEIVALLATACFLCIWGPTQDTYAVFVKLSYSVCLVLGCTAPAVPGLHCKR